MARILLSTFGSHGDINPYIVLGLALKARGHEAVVATLPGFRPEIEGAGLLFAPIRPDVDPADADLIRRIIDPARGSEFLVRGFMMPALRDTYADLERAAEGADLLVSHVLSYALPLLAEKKGYRWVSTVLSPMVFFSAHDPPVPPPAPFLGRLRVLGPGFNRCLIGLYKRMARSWSAAHREFRRDLGLPPGGDPIFEGQHSPYGVLGLFSPEFGPPQPDWPPRTKACGFLFRDSDFEGRGMDPALARFLADGPPPVVFTLGSSAVMTADGFYAEAARAAGDLGVRAVLLARAGAGDLRDLPPGVAAFPSAPYHLLFPAASAVVHSGGIGTTAQVLRAGKPQIVVPFAHDQFDNADRVRRLGLGRIGRRGRRMGTALHGLLADGAARARAAEVGRRVFAEDGAAAACDAIEEVLGSTTV